MHRVRIFACAGMGLVLATLGWLLSNAPDALTDVPANMLSRSAGLALLGVSIVAAGLVFRAAIRTTVKPALATTRLRASEYRRGFGNRVVRAQAQPRQPTQRGVVVSLRRATAEQAKEPTPADMGTKLAAAEIERLQAMLHSRAAQLLTRKTDMATRRFLRNGVDLHGLAPR
jgi:hypothetical protein